MQKLALLRSLASERAKQLDSFEKEETLPVVDSATLDVIEIRPIPQELPEIKPRLKAKKLELED